MDQFHEVVAEHDLAGRHGNRLARLESLHADGRLARDLPLPVVEGVQGALDERAACGFKGGLAHIGIGEEEVGRGQGVQHLVGGEIHGAGIGGRQAGHIERRPVPEGFGKAEGVDIVVPWRLAPKFRDEAGVAGPIFLQAIAAMQPWEHGQFTHAARAQSQLTGPGHIGGQQSGRCQSQCIA